MKSMMTTKAMNAVVTFVMLALFGASLFKALTGDVNLMELVTYGTIAVAGAIALMATDDEEVEEVEKEEKLPE